MDIGVEYLRQEVVRLALHGRVDSASAHAFAQRMEHVIASGCRRLAIDFGDVRYITSAGFRALLVADAKMNELSGQLALCCLPHDVQRLFDIGAFNDDFVIVPTLEECVVRLLQR